MGEDAKPARKPKARRVFVSYTAEDLIEHANVAIRAVQRCEINQPGRWIAVDHRTFAANGEPALEACRKQVRECDVLVVLVAHRYGWVPPPACD